jgi:hypothetical protein
MKIAKSITTVFFAITLIAALSACQKGPAEKAGEKIDNAAASAGQQIEKTGEKIQDAAQGDKK